MAADNQTQERKVSLSVSIRVASMTQAQAAELENKIRDVCDDYEGTDVLVTRGEERPALRK